MRVHQSNNPNCSDLKVIVCYLGLYEEGKVEHINNVWSSFLDFTASFVENKQNMSHVQPYTCVTNPFKRLPCFCTSGLFDSKSSILDRGALVGPLICSTSPSLYNPK